MSNLNQNTVQFLPIQNQMMPSGPSALAARISIDFSAQSDYDLDMQAVQSQGKFDRCQSMFIDNADGGAPIFVTFKGSGQRIALKGGWQGWFNVVSPNPISLHFASAGGALCNVLLTDVAIPGATWAAV